MVVIHCSHIRSCRDRMACLIPAPKKCAISKCSGTKKSRVTGKKQVQVLAMMQSGTRAADFRSQCDELLRRFKKTSQVPFFRSAEEQ